MMHMTDVNAQAIMLWLFAGLAVVGASTIAVVAYVVIQNIREACKHKPDANRWSRDWDSIESNMDGEEEDNSGVHGT